MTFSSLLSIRSHPVRVRGLKQKYYWLSHISHKSHPVRVRGLKHNDIPSCTQLFQVAPRAGAWIETQSKSKEEPKTKVAPRAGAWIETITMFTIDILPKVAPRAGAWIETRWRPYYLGRSGCRTPCGCVD